MNRYKKDLVWLKTLLGFSYDDSDENKCIYRSFNFREKNGEILDYFLFRLVRLLYKKEIFFKIAGRILLYLKEYGFRCDTKNNKENIYQKLLKSIRENLLSLS